MRNSTLIREAVAYLRSGAELGFGSLADPDRWLARLAMPASVLSSAESAGCRLADGYGHGVRQTFKGEAAKFPRLAERAAALRRFSPPAHRHSPRDSAQWRNQRRRFAALRRIRAGIAQARDKIQNSLESILRARGASRPAKTTSRCATTASSFPCAPRDRRAVPGVVHARQRHGPNGFRRAARNHRAE